MAEHPAPAGTAGTGRPRRRRLLAGALVALLVVAAVVGCSAMRQSLVYPASHYDHGEFERRVASDFGGRASVVAPFDAIVVEPPQSASPPSATAIYFHGNGDVNTRLAELVPVFTDRHMRLVLPEYPGYGARPGEPSERGLIDDGMALRMAVAARYPGSPIIVVGQSLGSAVAVQVAAGAALAAAPVRLVLITPFLNLNEAASHSVWGLPVGPLFSERYDSAAALARYAGPTTVLIAGKDRMLGPEQGRRLAQTPRAKGTTVVVEVPQGDHDTWFRNTTGAEWDTLLGTAPSR